MRALVLTVCCLVTALALCAGADAPDVDRWLRVEGRFIVDASGQPFRLVGMGRYEPERGMDNKTIGSTSTGLLDIAACLADTTRTAKAK